MSSSTRLNRGGLAFLAVGSLSMVLPADMVSFASSGKCTDNNAGPSIVMGVVGASAIYGAATGLFGTAGNDKKKKNSALDEYVYHGDKDPPAIFDRWGLDSTTSHPIMMKDHGGGETKGKSTKTTIGNPMVPEGSANGINFNTGTLTLSNASLDTVTLSSTGDKKTITRSPMVPEGSANGTTLTGNSASSGGVGVRKAGESKKKF